MNDAIARSVRRAVEARAGFGPDGATGDAPHEGQSVRVDDAAARDRNVLRLVRGDERRVASPRQFRGVDVLQVPAVRVVPPVAGPEQARVRLEMQLDAALQTDGLDEEDAAVEDDAAAARGRARVDRLLDRRGVEGRPVSLRTVRVHVIVERERAERESRRDRGRQCLHFRPPFTCL